MGEVFRARHDALSRPVALKRIRSAVARDPRQRRRILREAALVARLRHPAIVRVHDSFEAGGEAWIAMEWVPGMTLAERLRQGVLPWPEALRLGRQITTGLQAAHDEGIIHCDLKVENVLVTPEGTAKIVDFGIARLLGEAPPVPAGRVVGTPRVLSPEQVMGLEVDPRSDFFALGVLFYEILTGVSPFAGEPREEVLARICTFIPPSVDQRVITIPPAVARIVEWLLEKDPTHRPQAAEEVLHWLEEALAEASPGAGLEGLDLPGPVPRFGATTAEGTTRSSLEGSGLEGSG
jgi:serine/threonine-protein kinase